ncbi:MULTISPECIES: hypothetical protein [unclassified Streptomyces]|uniref:hypothetical protein n=1 Tax=unclassified Streptomyces TaxID=2593676 RepID=UPI002E2BA92E|nr:MULTISPECIES: hypothetical protein [unclassified Streptomyces]WUB88644.1 hypothetical protein OG812_19535 [Streptomyces sp. NBC_00566]
MDADRMTRLITEAVASGICDHQLLGKLDGLSSVESGSVAKANLLHTYRRRINRTPTGSDLHKETASLLSFLEKHQQDDLTMASATFEDGRSELFLLDAEGDRILHWMRMFSRG